jgi:hypothetical protein
MGILAEQVGFQLVYGLVIHDDHAGARQYFDSPRIKFYDRKPGVFEQLVFILVLCEEKGVEAVAVGAGMQEEVFHVIHQASASPAEKDCKVVAALAHVTKKDKFFLALLCEMRHDVRSLVSRNTIAKNAPK